MATRQKMLQRLVIGLATGTTLPAWAFNSGSTGADGPLNPTVSVEIPLPPNGVLNYTSVNIPNGVTVTFKRNATNTPVVMLVQGNVTVGGVIDVSGQHGADMGTSGDGDLSDDGQPGTGGPGGFDGGHGGIPGVSTLGGSGLGPGAGQGGRGGNQTYGGNASYGTEGYRPWLGVGAVYGDNLLIPLVGGSGGGGGSAYDRDSGRTSGGGGGGGGALLLACSGEVTISGAITSNGGTPGSIAGVGAYWGGAGSGGAIRVIASAMVVTGTINAAGGTQPPVGWGANGLYLGGHGRIRLEAERFGALAATIPTFTDGAPGPIFIEPRPALRFQAIGGFNVPLSPVGRNDLTLPGGMPNPVAVSVATSGVPVGAIVTIRSTPEFGAAPISADSLPTTGTLASATTSVNIDIAPGHSVLSAQTSYTLVASMGDSLSRFAHGERVERITLSATLGSGAPHAVLTTVSGKRFDAPPAALALLASAP